MIKYFIIGLFIGGIFGYSTAAIMNVIDKGDDGL